jgi:hypothetical protein
LSDIESEPIIELSGITSCNNTDIKPWFIWQTKDFESVEELFVEFLLSETEEISSGRYFSSVALSALERDY